MNDIQNRLARVLVASGIVAGILYFILWGITNPGKFFALWPTGYQAWALGGFVVAGVVIIISGLCGFPEIVGYIRSKNCNVLGAFFGIFFFLLVIGLLCVYGEHLYFQFIVYSNNPDMKGFTGYSCTDVRKLASQFPQVDFLQISDYERGYYYSTDYSGTKLANCGTESHFTVNAIWNGTHWIESTQHSAKAQWNGTQWLEPPTSNSIWNSTTTSWTISFTNNTTTNSTALTEGTELQSKWDGKLKDCSWIDGTTGEHHHYYSTGSCWDGKN